MSGQALVTGATGGIGTAVAHHLRERGYSLLLSDQPSTALDELSCATTDSAIIPADVTDRRALHELADRLECEDIDIAFVNAGVVVPGDLTELTREQVELQLQVNLVAAIVLIHAIARGMRERRRGHLVVTVSMGGILALKGSATYSATKFGLRGLLAGLAQELRPYGVRVSGLYPSGVDTPMLRHEATHGGSALNFLATPQTTEDVVAAFDRALRTGRTEVYLSRIDGLQCRLAGNLPSITPRITPLLERWGERGRAKYLRARQ